MVNLYKGYRVERVRDDSFYADTFCALAVAEDEWNARLWIRDATGWPLYGFEIVCDRDDIPVEVGVYLPEEIGVIKEHKTIYIKDYYYAEDVLDV